MKLSKNKCSNMQLMNKKADYSSLFLVKKDFKIRQCVYISQQVHSTILKIVRVISNNDITVGSYIDNILIEHLETHKDEIIEMYNKELSKNDVSSLIDF